MSELSFRPGFSSVIFDCDFTLSKIQGINEIANSLGKSEIAQLIHSLTQKVIKGEKKLEDVFAETYPTMFWEEASDSIIAYGAVAFFLNQKATFSAFYHQKSNVF